MFKVARYLKIGAIGLLPSAAMAVDLTLLAGLQANGDFEDTATGENIGVQDGAAFAVALDFPLNGSPTERLGLYLGHQATRFASDAQLSDRDLGITHLHFTAMSLWPNGRWEPFLLLGLGVAYFSPDDSTLDADTFVSGQIAGGTSLKVTERFLLRFGARWLPTFFDGGGAVFCNGSCTIAVKSQVWSQGLVDVGLQFRF
jgi:hypothetical protein